jgi:hypothetical protein
LHSAVTGVLAVEHKVQDDETQDRAVDRDLEISELRAVHEKELNDLRSLLEDTKAKHQQVVAEFNSRIEELQADHIRTIADINDAHRVEVENLQTLTVQRASEQQDLSVSSTYFWTFSNRYSVLWCRLEPLFLSR